MDHANSHDAIRSTLEALWGALGDSARPLPPVRLHGPCGGLPSAYRVDVFAAATVALATAAIAEVLAARSGQPLRAVDLEPEHAAAAFRSERYLQAIGWQLPDVWDPIAGDYAASDGWVRIHTNYAYHRDAARRALGTSESRDEVARAVARRSADDVEAAVVAEGGAAAALRSAEAWQTHAQGCAVAAEPLFLSTTSRLASEPARLGSVTTGASPLRGIRVLDLTRVMAGPVCTRLLAAYGADVLRIDPPGFVEVGAILPDMTSGKRRAALDLRTPDGRETFRRLVEGADLLVSGYRASALERLGLSSEQLHAWNPALGVVLLDAYGWSGPWRDRRGFDSLVQMSAGIAAPAEGAGSPRPLPAQALDHGAGYLLAAAACRALTERARAGVVTTTRVSLARVAKALTDLGRSGYSKAPELADVERWCERAESSFGPIRRVRCPGSVDGFVPRWDLVPGALGVDPPAWSAP